MPGNNEILLESEPTPANAKAEFRKPYLKPQLAEMGDLRTTTLGSSPFDTPDSDFSGLWDNT